MTSAFRRMFVAATLLAASAAVVAAAPQPGTGSAAGTGSQDRATAPRPGQERRAEVLRTVWGVRLGVTLRELDAAAAREHKLPSADGLLVESVQARSPAEIAGIRTGDVIVEFEGEHVRSIRQLRRLVAETPEGKAARIVVMRGGHRTELSVTPQAIRSIGEHGETDREAEEELQRALRDVPEDVMRAWPRGRFWHDDEMPGYGMRRFPRLPEEGEQPLFAEPPVPPGRATRDSARLGVVVQSLTPDLAEYFGVKHGVLVAAVTPESAAARAGVKAGDVITAVNKKAVSEPAELTRAVREAKEGGDVALEIVRDRKPQTVTVTLAAHGHTTPI